MNDRIKEIAAQCGFRPNPDIYDRNQSFDIPKFAELIVRECLVTISAKEIVDDRTEYEQGYNKALKSVYGDIVEKFGVEE